MAAVPKAQLASHLQTTASVVEALPISTVGRVVFNGGLERWTRRRIYGTGDRAAR
jgi:hypothetical protein